MTLLSNQRPPPYTHFQAFNDETGELFLNFLILSKYNRFYTAGKKFTRWSLIN